MADEDEEEEFEVLETIELVILGGSGLEISTGKSFSLFSCFVLNDEEEVFLMIGVFAAVEKMDLGGSELEIGVAGWLGTKERLTDGASEVDLDFD